MPGVCEGQQKASVPEIEWLRGRLSDVSSEKLQSKEMIEDMEVRCWSDGGLWGMELDELSLSVVGYWKDFDFYPKLNGEPL